MGRTESTEPTAFLKACVECLEEEIESIVYYGVCKKETKLPKSLSSSKSFFLIFRDEVTPKPKITFSLWLFDNKTTNLILAKLKPNPKKTKKLKKERIDEKLEN